MTRGTRLFADSQADREREEVPVLSGCEAHFLLTPLSNKKDLLVLNQRMIQQ